LAGELVGSHRLWEAYLAKHFALPDDRLHMPAERMEHFITPAMRAKLRDDLADPTHDPHGREIPGGNDQDST
jgi:manganese/zinc/iron transport system permease protein